MILLKSYGDRLALGNYKPLSRFKHAANFVCGDTLVCCVDESIGPGPFSVVITGTPIESIQSLIIEKRRLSINGESLGFVRSGRYCSKIESPPLVSRNKLNDSLKYFGDYMKQLSCPLSLIFLIDPGKESEFTSDFEIEYVRRLKSAVEYFFGDNYLEGVKRLRGLGFGLTPSGDDFLAGAMAALYVSQSVFKIDKSEKLIQIYEIARGGNPLVNAFLKCAKEGALIERFRDLIMAIFRGGLLDIKRCTLQLLETGATSGVDWGVGFYLTMKAELGSVKG